MRNLTIALVASLVTAPIAATAEPAPETPYQLVLRLLDEELGGVPPTARVNGVEVPSHEALGMLRVLDVQLAAADTLNLPDHDLGVAAGVPCTVPGGLFLAIAVGTEPVSALVNAQDVAVGVPQCGAGGKLGATGGDISPDASAAVACVILGAFVNEGGPGCHADDFGGITVAGNYEELAVDFCFPGIACLSLVVWLVYLGAVSLSN